MGVCGAAWPSPLDLELHVKVHDLRSALGTAVPEKGAVAQPHVWVCKPGAEAKIVELATTEKMRTIRSIQGLVAAVGSAKLEKNGFANHRLLEGPARKEAVGKLNLPGGVPEA